MTSVNLEYEERKEGLENRASLRKVLGILLVSLLLTSCFDTFERKELIDNYYLLAIDLPENMTLTYNDKRGSICSQVIPPTIYEVQWGDRYILLKSHPMDIEESIKNVLRSNYLKCLRGVQYQENIYYTADTLAQRSIIDYYNQENLVK